MGYDGTTAFYRLAVLCRAEDVLRFFRDGGTVMPRRCAVIGVQFMSSVAYDASATKLRNLPAAAFDDPPGDRRDERRQPFFTPVTLRRERAPNKPLYAFSRDLSPIGIGLLHHVPLDPGETYTIDFKYRGRQLEAEAEVLWCTEAGEGWYLSGCRFLNDE